MFGKLERDNLERVKCDKCGETPKYSTCRSSNAMREFIGARGCERKLFHLCLKCTRKVSPVLLKEVIG